MTKPMTVIQIVSAAIKQGGFDGLYDEHGECACELDDLAPCGGLQDGCTMGYRYVCNDDGCEYYGDAGPHWHMRSMK